MRRMEVFNVTLALALAGMTAVTAGESAQARLQAPVPGASDKRTAKMKIRITIAGKQATATLDNNETAKDFASLLPLTLTLKDYADNEKVSDVPKKLSTKGAPATYVPVARDITYYAPWGNLALFHKDGHDSPGLVKLGTIDSGVELLRMRGPVKATFDIVD
ncbi:MAG TPA: cyclophilin-like fold protein [Terriglobales bacterium]|nr:cyclophilin-like fold protein [Terriglobales bacterium]